MPCARKVDARACPITSTRAVAPEKAAGQRRLPKLYGHGQISPHLSTARIGQDMERQRAARLDVRALPTVGAVILKPGRAFKQAAKTPTARPDHSERA